jgi:hypothetical protein
MVALVKSITEYSKNSHGLTGDINCQAWPTKKLERSEY